VIFVKIRRVNHNSPNGVTKKNYYFLYLQPILNHVGVGDSHKLLFSDGEFRENRRREIRFFLLRNVNRPIFALPTFIFQLGINIQF